MKTFRDHKSETYIDLWIGKEISKKLRSVFLKSLIILKFS